MAEERINSFVDIAALEAERDKALGIIKQVTDVIAKTTTESASSTKNTTATSMKAAATEAESAAKSFKKVKAELTDLEKEEKALSRTTNQLVKAKALQTVEGQKLTASIAKEKAEIKQITFEQQRAANAARSQADYTRIFSEQMDLATMNLKEMQNELRRLNDMSFKGLNPEQIARVKAEMATLTDAIGDFQARVKVASTDRIPALMGALQGLTSVAQGVTGTLAIFGIENERLNQTMMGLINVSMALTTAQKMYEEKSLKVAAAHVKQMYASLSKTIALKGETLATTGATVATRLFGKAMSSLPILMLITGIAALGAAIYGLVKWMQPAESGLTKLAKAEGEVVDAAVKTSAELMLLSNNINNTTVGTKEHNKAIKEYNEVASKAGLKTLSYSDNMKDLNAAIELNTKLLYAQMFAEASRNQMLKATEEYLKIMGGNNSDFVKEKSTAMYKQMMDDLQSTERVMKSFIESQNEQTTAGSVFNTIITKSTSKLKENTAATTNQAVAISYVKDIYDGLYSILIKTTDQLEEIKPALEEIQLISDEAMKAVIDGNKQALYDLWQTGEITWERYGELFAMIRDAEQAQEEDEKKLHEARKQRVMDLVDYSMKTWDAYLSYKKAQDDAQVQAFEQQQAQEMTILDDRLASGILSQADYNAQKEQLELEYAQKKNAIEVEQAKRQKIFASFQVGIDTAKAIMNMWATSPFPINLIMSALAATTGAFQLAAINAQPLPAYKDGRDGGAAEWAITGDGGGREAIVTDNGIFLSPATPTLTYLPENASVLTAPETLQLMRSGFNTTTTENLTDKKLDGIINAINNKEFLRINITEKGLSMSAMRGANITKYINRNIRK